MAVLDLGNRDEADVTGLAAPPSALALDDGSALVGLGFSGETVTITDGAVGPPTPAVEGSAGRLTLAGGDEEVWVATITGDVHAPDGTLGWPTPAGVAGVPLRLGVEGTQAWVIGARAELVALDSSDTPAVRSPQGEAVDLTTGARRHGHDAGDEQLAGQGDRRRWPTSACPRRQAVYPDAVSGDAWRPRPGLSWFLDSPASLDRHDVRHAAREPVDLAVFDGRLVVAVR